MMANPFRGDDVDPYSGVRDKEGNIKQVKEKGVTKQIGLPRTAKLSPFGLAFDTARKAGSKTFEFKGKKYTTEMEKPKPKPKPKAKVASDTDIITKGATKLYEERMGPDKAALDRGAAAVKRGGGKNYGVSNLPDDIDRPINMKKGGKVESKLMKKEGRGMAKATMQKVASKVVRGHEKRMHKMKSGGSVSKRADGSAIRGKTRGRMV
jgi:hypothetical protein